MKRSLCGLVLGLSLFSACEGRIDTDPAGTGGNIGGTGTGGSIGSTGVGGGNVSGTGGGNGGGGMVPVVLPEFVPAKLQMRLLLSNEYRHSIRDIFGAPAAAAVTPPPDAAINGLTAIGASQLSVSTATQTIYEKNAYLAVQAALANATQRAKLIPCMPAMARDTACFTTVLNKVGQQVFRRPLTAAERTAWLKVADDAAVAYGTFNGGAEFMLAGLLLSPNFLYRAESGVPNAARPGELKLTGYEMATRLSYFISGTTPSDGLLAAAASGALDTPEGLKVEARKGLMVAGASAATTDFFSEFLSHEGLPSLAKDPISYPAYKPVMAASMAEETKLFLEEVLFVKNLDTRTLFDADYTYVDANLAPLYGMTAPGSGFARVTLPSNQPRAGILTQTAFLALMAHPASTSPTYRGKFVRERLLCETVAAPPINVSTTIPADNPTMPRTLRQKLSAHMTNNGCRNCHAAMDPIGFGFEHFDSIGSYRTLELGMPIDASGDLDNAKFTDAKGLSQILKNDPRVMACLTRTLFRHAAGHVDLPTEGRPLKALTETFVSSGYKYQDLLVELVASDAFRLARAADGVTP